MSKNSTRGQYHNCPYLIMINVLDTVSTFIHLPWMFLPTEIFLNNGLDNNGPPLYKMYMLNLG